MKNKNKEPKSLVVIDALLLLDKDYLKAQLLKNKIDGERKPHHQLHWWKNDSVAG